MQRFLNIRNTCVRTFPSTPRVPISRSFNSRPSSTRLNISHWSNSVIVSLEKRKLHTSVWSSAEISKTLDGDTSKLEGSNAPHQSSKINESSSTDNVVWWAEQFVETEDALKLKAQKINGKALRDLDALSLERCGILGGPASILANEIIKLKGVAQGYPPFSPSNYSFNYPTFEPNDEGLPLIERNEQVDFIKTTISNLSSAEKYEPIVISTSRGMGKTFLMKRLVRTERDSQSPIPEIEVAYRVGRIVTMECTSFQAEFKNNLPAYSKFWHVAIIYNLLQTFKGTSVDGINFDGRDIIGIYGYYDESLIKKNVVTSLDKWIFSAIRLPVKDLCLEMIRLTNIAFKTNSNMKPVFLLDNVHCLARIKTDIRSHLENTLYHTVLSQIINQLSEYRPPCIVAGTTDGNLKLVGEYSNFVPRIIFLTALTMQGAFTMGANIVAKMGKGICWPEKPEKDILLTALVYESCQIPRLLKLAFQCWHQGQINNNNNSFILEHFHTQGRIYYGDAINFITTLSARDCAILMLCCSVNYKISADFLPSTKVEIQKLVDASIIFPQTNNSYVIPVFFWFGLNEQSAKNSYITNFDTIFSHWKEVHQKIKELVPGLCFDDLFIYSKKWWLSAPSLTAVGYLWEKLVASSLVVKYFIHTLHTKTSNCKPDMPLSEIYYISEKAQAYPVISQLMINFSDGIQTPLNEVTVFNNPNCKALFVNSKTPTAHHDIIFSETAAQCKNTLTDPKGKTIAKQLEGCKYLLWFYPGLNEGSPKSPKKYRTEAVKNALSSNHLAFLSGAGSVSCLSLEMIKTLKNMSKPG